MLNYHSAILQFLGVSPVISAERVAVLDQRQEFLGIRVPASVIEWFSLENADSIFLEHSDQDLCDYRTLGNQWHVANGYLHVATENQAVVCWFVSLTSDPDPPVLATPDWEWLDEEADDGFKSVQWLQDGRSFSGFVFDILARRPREGWASSNRVVASRLPWPSAETFELLSNAYSEGPVNDDPDCRTRRFFDSRTHFRISDCSVDQDAALRQAGRPSTTWEIEASDEEALLAVLSIVQSEPDLIKRLQAKLMNRSRSIEGPGAFSARLSETVSKWLRFWT